MILIDTVRALQNLWQGLHTCLWIITLFYSLLLEKLLEKSSHKSTQNNLIHLKQNLLTSLQIILYEENNLLEKTLDTC